MTNEQFKEEGMFPVSGEQNWVSRIKEMELTGCVVMIDMTASTELKMAREFPDWVEYVLEFEKIVAESFPLEEFPDRKFLGDAFMIFTFLEGSEAIASRYSRKVYKALDILKKAEYLMYVYWLHHKAFRERKKGADKPIRFREITCAIDFGNKIINIAELFSDSAESLDPVGTPVDRCFRISSIAAPGQLLISSEFYELLDETIKEKILKISLAKDTLKGFPDVTNVYYVLPHEEVQNHILEENQVELVEKTKDMAAKVKIKLLRRDRDRLKKELDASLPSSSASNTEEGKNEKI